MRGLAVGRKRIRSTFVSPHRFQYSLPTLIVSSCVRRRPLYEGIFDILHGTKLRGSTCGLCPEGCRFVY